MVGIDEPIEDLVSSKEAAEIIGVKVNNFRQMVFQKKISVAYKRGREVVFHRRDVEALRDRRLAKIQ
jgi:predicted HTH domain antitoxin